MNKRLITLLLIMFLIGGGIYWVWQSRSLIAPVITPEPVVVTEPNQSETSIDTSNWKTYRNEEYRFEVKYPESWAAEEFMSAGIGAPIDCKVTPEKCQNFSVKFSSPDKTIQPVVLETSKKISGEKVAKDPNTVKLPTWEKNISGNEFLKSNNYFEIFGSCFTTASTKNMNPKKDVSYYFFKFYEPVGLTVEEIAEYCSKEITDPVFDHIVASFQLL